MKTRVLIGIGLLCASSMAADQDPEAESPPLFPQLQTATFDGGRRIDILRVPLLGYAAPRLADGHRALLLLTRVGETVDPEFGGFATRFVGGTGGGLPLLLLFLLHPPKTVVNIGSKSRNKIRRAFLPLK